MILKLKIFAIILVVGILAMSCTTKTSTEAKKPNMLIVLCDDLGYNDVGFNGSEEITTPALDGLAHSGIIFSSAYVAHPFCGPSRASLMTGRYAHTIGAQFNLPPNAETIGKGISTDETFISTVLQNAGYYTGIVGKWHLGSVEQYHPNNRGFTDFYGFLGGGHNYFPGKYLATYEKQKKEGRKVIFEYLLPLEHNGKEVRSNKYLTDELSDAAIDMVNNANEQEKPFFLYLSYNAPHVPLEAKKEDLEKFSYIEDLDRRTYAAMVYAVDRGVEKLVNQLKANGQYDNTLIVFFSDNGGKTTKGANNYPLREGKGSTCEGGYRVPMFFHWPNKIKNATRFEYPIKALDLYPTLAQLAGAEIPEGKVLDGKDIWADVMNGTNAHPDEFIYCLRHREGYTDVGVRKNEWKALKVQQKDWQLINLSQDIGENIDLSDQHPELLKELVEGAEKWSGTHQQPLWWHDEATGIDWMKDEMPHFDRTFQLNQ